MGPQHYSESKMSPMIELFARRAGAQDGDPEEAMKGLIVELRRSSRQRGLATQFDAFLIKRRIVGTETVAGLTSDGYIEPIGTSFRDGFRIKLKREAPQTRRRFTIAHELCHTFFYEIVPELKYGAREADQAEERLCNLGAAELLIPAKSLRARAKSFSISLDSLEELAAMYVVSIEAMLLRLRSLRLWDCELSFWRPKGDGGFSMDRILGGRKVNWIWSEDAPLRTVWKTNQKLAGRTYVELRDSRRGLQLRPVCFQIARRGDALVALWSARPIQKGLVNLPLFEA
jgi:hypothetical protein